MNIIIVGCGKVGQKLAEKLSFESEHEVTVIDLRNKIVSELASQNDIMGVCGSGTSFDTLTEAGIKDTHLLIAVTGSDEINLLTCFIAKKLGNCQTIARVRKPEYAKELSLFKEDLGLAMIINPEQTAAAEIARVLRFPTAIQIDTFAKGKIEILKFKVPADSTLDGLKVVDITTKLKCNVLVCGVERGKVAIIPGGEFEFTAGDRVSIVASPKDSTEFFKKISLKTNKVKDTIIVGGGNTAFYLAKGLLATGINVKIIEQNTERCEHLCNILPKATIINADGTDNKALLEAGIEYADSFVALTNIDEENILLSLFAKSKMEGKLITKINRIAYDNVISNLDLDTTIYPKNITAEYIVRFVRAMENSLGSNIEAMHEILDGKAEALEFNIKKNAPVIGIPLEEMKLKKNILVASIIHNGKLIIPKGKDVISEGDTVIIVTTATGLTDIKDILR